MSCKYLITICLLSFGFSTLGQSPITVTPSSQPPKLADVIKKINASIVRVTATFSYQEQEDPNLTSALRRTPLAVLIRETPAGGVLADELVGRRFWRPALMAILA
jgi:hypothetical protein